MKWFAWMATALAFVTFTQAAPAKNLYITLASTTSTQNSGLFRHILPVFTKSTKIGVRVVAVGTGAALRLGKAGDVDIVLVHHRTSEEQFVADGFGIARHPIMYNDFVVVGPKFDPAGIAGAATVAQAVAMIAERRALFVSRGDDSGTHRRELDLWKLAGVDPRPHSGTWYRETGSGMGATLQMAAASDAYTLADRATWLSFKNKRALSILHEGDLELFNEYGAIVVSPKRHPHVKVRQAQRFVDWLMSAPGREAIASYRLAGEQLFYPLR
ncbi:MAG: tungstate transport system substrate-binding protein [Gammaproteobacteria bacterium]|jgi:tungstate transport system substrate-binding protein